MIRTSSAILLLWALLLALLAYAYVALRYYYRTPTTITVLQCRATDFRADTLSERQPLVCAAVGDTEFFVELLRHADHAEEHTGDAPRSPFHLPPTSAATVYARLQHFAPWFGRRAPIALVVPPRATDEGALRFTQSFYDVRLLVALRGALRVRIALPQHMDRPSVHVAPDAVTSLKYVEILVRAGDAVFVPFLWGVEVVGEEEGGRAAETEGTGDGGDVHEGGAGVAVYADVGWRHGWLDGWDLHRCFA